MSKKLILQNYKKLQYRDDKINIFFDKLLISEILTNLRRFLIINNK